MGSRYLHSDNESVIVPVATAQDVEVGDLVCLDSDTVEKASDESWDSDLATTQANFVAKFLGVSSQRKLANVARVFGNSTDNRMRAVTAGVYEFDCASASFDVGDLVGPAKQTGNALEDQKVVAVANETLAIGKVVEKTISSTKVTVRLLSTLMPAARQVHLGVAPSANIVALTDSTTGTAGDTVNDTTSSVKDDIASLAAKVNAIIAALKAANIVASA